MKSSKYGQTLKRPSEWAGENATLFDRGGVEFTDIGQGSIGDCWFIAAVGGVAAVNPDLIQHRFVGCYPELGCYVVSQPS